MSDWEIMESCLFGYSGSGPIPDARAALARLRTREQELEKRIAENIGSPALSDGAARQMQSFQVQAAEAEARADAAIFERQQWEVETRRLEARVQELEARLEAKDELLVAYRLGDHVRADRALTKLAALEPRAEE